MGGQLDSLLPLDALVRAVRGTVAGDVAGKDFSFTSVQTDSRLVVPGTLFVPLVGEFQDGHTYIPEALERGASVVLAARNSFEPLEDTVLPKAGNARIILVDNTLHALQAAAAAYVEQFPSLIKIGITGSNGKTTTKELCASVLGEKYTVVATEGNLNSETGLPLSVFKIRDEHQVGVFELGMNRAGEISELAAVLKPQYAVITGIGTAHIGILGSRDAIAAEKKAVFSQFTEGCVGFVPENDPYRETLENVPRGTVRAFGPRSTPGVGDVEDAGLFGTRFSLNGTRIQVPLAGSYNFMNALSAVSLALELGLDEGGIKRGIEKTKPLFGRSNVIRGRFTVVEDCYNANAESMGESMRFYGGVSLETPGAKKVFVLGDMFELGAESDAIHARIAEQALQSGAGAVAFVGEAMCRGARAAEKKLGGAQSLPAVWCEELGDDAHLAALAETVAGAVYDGDLVLVKGSRGMHLERISGVLLEKADGAV